MFFLVASFVDADVHQTVKTGGAGCLQLLIHPPVSRCHPPCAIPLVNTLTRYCGPRRCSTTLCFVYRTHSCSVSTHTFCVPTFRKRQCRWPRPLSHCFSMADAALALLPFRWLNGQFGFIYLGVDSDVLLRKSICSDDGLNKPFGSH